jgi:ribulose-5-phosphate 4-epimerase/fuculose-1-phosphate aldolase
MTEQETREELAAVYRLVYHNGWDDLIYTHISARIPNTNTILINKFGLLFSEVTASNLVKVDIDGTVIGDGNINPAGFLVHSAIHEARPDITCAIHTHTKEGIAVSIDKRGLWPISQTAMLLMNDISYHDYRGLILDKNEKELLKNSIANKDYMIMKNHGLLTVGKSICDAFLNMRRLQNACEVQVLCDYEHAIFIEKSVIDDNQNKIRFLNSKNDIPWQALLKIVQTHYPDYKN